MLMIGSAGSNVGKTELACAIIRKFANRHPITAFKVTTIKEKDGQCPRGGEGCGVCSSLEGNFDIREETDSETDKDTARLLRAGAKKVFWLRCLQSHLRPARDALLKTIEKDHLIICESNSMRQAVRPAAFVMVKNNPSQSLKQSAQEVAHLADEILISENNDFDLNRISIANNQWHFDPHFTAFILAGGQSKRMGRDKSLLAINGKPLIQHITEQLKPLFHQIAISSNKPEKYSFLNLPVIADKIPDQGPLMAILSCLEQSNTQFNFFIACDIPEIDTSFIKKLLDRCPPADITIPTTTDNEPEPLFGVYRKSLIPAIENTLSEGKRAVREVFDRCRVSDIPLKPDKPIKNLNTLQDFDDYISQTNIPS